MSLPKIVGLFRLTRAAELKYTQDGKPILKMGLASSEKFGDRETQCFVDATVFGKPAEILNQWAGEKGTQIYLTGKLQTETWVDKESGQNRSKHSMIVEGFDFVSKPKGNCEEKPPYQMPEPNYEDHPDKPKPVDMPKNNLPEIDINEDEIIPF